MKRAVLVSLVTLLACGCSSLGRSSDPAPVDRIVGTWEHVSADMSGYRQIKMVTGSHFMWVTYERQTGMLVASAGGECFFDGKTYIERLDFGSEPFLLDLIGKDQVFTARLEGGEWYHSGTLTDGTEVREVWNRLQ